MEGARIAISQSWLAISRGAVTILGRSRDTLQMPSVRTCKGGEFYERTPRSPINRQQQRLLAYGLSDHYRRIFELTRVSEAIVIDEAEEIAASAR